MPDQPAIRPSSTSDRTAPWVYAACGLLMLTIFIGDLSIPLGVAMGVPYIIVVLISLWSPRNLFTVVVGIVCSALTIAAFFYKPAVPEMWKAVVNRILSLLVIWVAVMLGLQRKVVEQNREKAIREREKALEEVRVLRGLLPICSSCKKIRDDQGYWKDVAGFITEHSEAVFSHGLCNECAEKLYPEYYKQTKQDSNSNT